VTHSVDRRTNLALRARVDQLLHRVRDARTEIIERGLDAVKGSGKTAAASASRARGVVGCSDRRSLPH
jgi:hypothetical protein